jgi:hypothetical protein
MKLLILVVNMLESSPEAVNHLRMKIEECHSNNIDVPKSILLLLHFPSSMFLNGNYPTLFLHGWNYRYINSLASRAESGLIDVQLWVRKCLDKTSSLEIYGSSLSDSLLRSAKRSIPLLMADFKSNKYINKQQMNVVLDAELTKLVCDRFLEYFKGHLHIKYLEDVADGVFQQTSTIDLKTQIEEKIKDNFFYFMKYIVSFFHVHGVTTALLNVNSNEFLCALIPHTPVPHLVKLADEVSHFPQAILEGKCNYQLPFFSYVFEEIEAIIRSGMLCIINANEEEQKSIKRGDILASVITIMQKTMQVRLYELHGSCLSSSLFI